MWPPIGAYEFYVAALHASVQLAVLLSLLVSADRVLNVLKFGCIKLRAKLTGRLPQDRHVFAPLPKRPEDYPLVSAWCTAAIYPRPQQLRARWHAAACETPSCGGV